MWYQNFDSSFLPFVCECQWGRNHDSIYPGKGTHFCADAPEWATYESYEEPTDEEGTDTPPPSRGSRALTDEELTEVTRERRIQGVLSRVLMDVEDDALLGPLTADPRLRRVAAVVREVRDQP
jgi:hypothetical protein